MQTSWALLALMAAKCEETCFCLDLAGWKLTLVVQKALCQQMSASCTMLLFPAPHFASLVQHGDCFLMLWKYVHSSLFEMESPSSNEDSDAIQRGIGLLWRRQLPTGDWPQENIAGVSGSPVALLSDRVTP